MTLRKWPYTVPASWFVLVVVASGLILFVQYTWVGAGIPVQTLARLALVAQAFIAIAAVGTSSDPRLNPALLIFLLSATVPAVTSIVMADESSEPFAEFAFMYGNAVLLVLFLFAPVVVRETRLFRVFCVVAVLFGILQVLRQDLMLPDQFRENFGVVFDHFVNDHIRATSFFASPPRFAELLVFIASYIQFGLISGRRRTLVSFAVYAVVLFALYNTFSRSGYVLFLVTLAIQLVLMRTVAGQTTRAATVRLYFVVLGLAVFVSLLVLGRLPIDSSVVDTTSLDARQAHWSTLWAQLSSGDAWQFVFGTGRSARFSYLSANYFVVDNILLVFFLYAGLFGLFGFLFLYFTTFRAGLRSRAIGGHEKWDPMLAFYLALLAEGMFLDNHNTIFVTQFAVLGMLTVDRLRQAEPDHPDTQPPATVTGRVRLAARRSATT